MNNFEPDQQPDEKRAPQQRLRLWEKTAVGTVSRDDSVPAARLRPQRLAVAPGSRGVVLVFVSLLTLSGCMPLPAFSGVPISDGNGQPSSATPREIVFSSSRPIGRGQNAGEAFKAVAPWVASGVLDFSLESLATLGRVLAGALIVAAAVALLLLIIGLVRGFRAHRRNQRDQ